VSLKFLKAHPFYIGLLHYPVYNRNGDIIASAITNLDIHDLARCAETYGAKRFYIINPFEDQQRLIKRICRHWTEGFGAGYNKHRRDAVSLVSIAASLESAISEIESNEGETPILIATDAARNTIKNITYNLAKKIVASDRMVMILFGTAWGISKELIEKSDYILEPIFGVSDYNHLSVRSASAIILDRLFSQFTIFRE
jgi:hypothetical protein